jgi:conjugative transposon TraJ protein
MKNKILKAAGIAALATLLPLLSHAQDTGVADDIHSLQGVLENLYNQMMPLCSGMIGVARGIAGFAALWYIGARVWKHIAAAEAIDIYPLLRPFAIGFCIAFFPLVLALINGVLQPVVTATQGMVTNSNQAIATMLTPAQPGTTTQGSGLSPGNADPDKYYQYTHPDNTTGTSAASANPIADAFSGWSIKDMVRKWIAELLNIGFESAALCIDTIRTFKLIVLAILGPLCFGLSIFDGFQHTLKQWLARYVNVFMWLPIANIFGAIIGKIQVNMIAATQTGNLQGNEFGNSNTAYLIFLVIGIVGYFTVPSIANYIMNVGGHALFTKTSALTSMAVSYASGAIMQSFSKTNPQQSQPAQQNNSGGNSGGNTHNKDKLTGAPPKS